MNDKVSGFTTVGARQFQREASKAMNSTWNVLVELITNVDDSYERLERQNSKSKDLENLRWVGSCQIIYERGGKTKPSTLIVKDKAEGFSETGIKERISESGGAHTAGNASRGFNNKGLKDVAFVCPVNIYTQRDGMFIYATIDNTKEIKDEKGNSHPGKFEYKTVKWEKIPQEYKRYLNIKKNQSGTTVHLQIPPDNDKFSNTKFSTLRDNLANHYALSWMLKEEDKNLELTLHDGFKDKKGTKIIYNQPLGEKIIDEKWSLDEYKKEFNCDTSVKFTVYKSNESLAASLAASGIQDKDVKKWGIAVMGYKTCYEKNLFGDYNLNSNPLAKHFFGYLRTELIDKALEPFKKANAKTTHLNPKQIHDANRVAGLDTSHPLTKKLFSKATKLLNDQLKNETSDKVSVTENFKKLQENVANLMNEILGKEELTEKDRFTVNSIPVGTFKFVPPVNRIKIMEEKTLYIYTPSESLEKNLLGQIVLSDNGEFIEVYNNESAPIINADGKAYFKFKIKGKNVSDKDINVSFFYNKKVVPKTTCSIKVENYGDRNFIEMIEFDNLSGIYKVKEKSSKKIVIFARCPGVVENIETFDIKYLQNDVVTSTSNGPPPQKLKMHKFKNTNYAKGEFHVKGKTLGASTDIIVSYKDLSARSTVKVLNLDNEPKHPFSFQIVKENYKTSRYMWNPRNQNQLLIGCEHPALKMYFGNIDNMGKYENLEKIETKSILAEVVTDAVAKKNIERKYRSEGSTDEVSSEEVISAMEFEKNTLLEKFHHVFQKS